jgi:hypothetical protein
MADKERREARALAQKLGIPYRDAVEMVRANRNSRNASAKDTTAAKVASKPTAASVIKAPLVYVVSQLKEALEQLPAAAVPGTQLAAEVMSLTRVDTRVEAPGVGPINEAPACFIIWTGENDGRWLAKILLDVEDMDVDYAGSLDALAELWGEQLGCDIQLANRVNESADATVRFPRRAAPDVLVEERLPQKPNAAEEALARMEALMAPASKLTAFTDSVASAKRSTSALDKMKATIDALNAPVDKTKALIDKLSAPIGKPWPTFDGLAASTDTWRAAMERFTGPSDELQAMADKVMMPSAAIELVRNTQKAVDLMKPIQAATALVESMRPDFTTDIDVTKRAAFAASTSKVGGLGLAFETASAMSKLARPAILDAMEASSTIKALAPCRGPRPRSRS